MTASTRLPLPKECSRRFGRLREVVRSTLHKQKWSYGRLLMKLPQNQGCSEVEISGSPNHQKPCKIIGSAGVV